ncbi:8964_t:CDS:1, partial [Ambispora leptoticha]
HYDNYKWETTYVPVKSFQPAPNTIIEVIAKLQGLYYYQQSQ